MGPAPQPPLVLGSRPAQGRLRRRCAPARRLVVARRPVSNRCGPPPRAWRNTLQQIPAGCKLGSRVRAAVELALLRVALGAGRVAPCARGEPRPRTAGPPLPRRTMAHPASPLSLASKNSSSAYRSSETVMQGEPDWQPPSPELVSPHGLRRRQGVAPASNWGQFRRTAHEEAKASKSRPRARVPSTSFCESASAGSPQGPESNVSGGQGVLLLWLRR